MAFLQTQHFIYLFFLASKIIQLINIASGGTVSRIINRGWQDVLKLAHAKQSTTGQFFCQSNKAWLAVLLLVKCLYMNYDCLFGSFDWIVTLNQKIFPSTDEGRRRCRNMFAKLKVVVYVLKILTSLLINRPFPSYNMKREYENI